MLHGVPIDSASGYSIEMNLLILTTGARAINYSEFTYIPSTVRAVVARRAEKKLIPAFSAQGVVGFADALFAVDANRRPKELI